MSILLYLLAALLVGHGLAHLSGVFAPWTKDLLGYADSPWLFTSSITLKSLAGRVYSLIWLAAAACLVFSGAELLLRQRSWIPVAVAGCVLSLAAILPWWKAVPPGARFGAAFDLIVIIVLFSPLAAQILRHAR